MQRLLMIILIGPSSLLEASAWRSETSAESRFQQLRLITNKADNLTQEPFWGTSAGINLSSQSTQTLLAQELLIDYGESFETRRNFKSLVSRSILGLRQGRSSSTFSFSALASAGTDPINLPLELAALQINDRFQSFQLGYVYAQELNVRNSLGVELNLSRNKQNEALLDTADVQMNWTQRHSRTWTNTWRLRWSEQQGANANRNKQREFATEHLIAFNPQLSADLGIGYNDREDAGENSQGLIMLAVFSYSSQTLFPKDEQEGFRLPTPLERPDLDTPPDKASPGIARVGWQRSRDQRRTGDAIFIADQYFFTALMAVASDQALGLDVFRTETLGDLASESFREDSAKLSYRWQHNFGSGPAALRGIAGLEAGVQNVEQNANTYQREIYTVRYSLIF